MSKLVSRFAFVLIAVLFTWLGVSRYGISAAEIPDVKLSIPSAVSDQTRGMIVSGDKISVKVTSKLKAPQAGLFVHLFQVEQGQTNYFYQGSAAILGTNSDDMIDVYLGGIKDYNKNYKIIAVYNSQPEYQKDPKGVYMVKNLPATVVDTISVYRDK